MRLEYPIKVQVLGDYDRIVESEDIDKIWDANTHGEPFVIKYIRKPDIVFDFDDNKDDIYFTFYPVVVCYKNKAFLIGDIEYPIDVNNIKPINDRPIVLKQVRYLMKNYHTNELYVGVKYYEFNNKLYPKLIITHNRFLVDVLFCVVYPFESKIECQPELYKTIWELEQLFKKLDEIYVGLRIYDIKYPNPIFSNSTFAVDITFENRALVKDVEFDLLSLDYTTSYLNNYNEDPNNSSRFYLSVNGLYTEIEPLPIKLKVKLTNIYGITSTYYYDVDLIGKSTSVIDEYTVEDYSNRIELQEPDDVSFITVSGYGKIGSNYIIYEPIRWPYSYWFIGVIPTKPGVYWVDVDNLTFNPIDNVSISIDMSKSVLQPLKHMPVISSAGDNYPPISFYPATGIINIRYSTNGFKTKTETVPVPIERADWPTYTINRRLLLEENYPDLYTSSIDNSSDVDQYLLDQFPINKTGNVIVGQGYCGYADIYDLYHYKLISGTWGVQFRNPGSPGDFVMNNLGVFRLDIQQSYAYTFFEYEYSLAMHLNSIPKDNVGIIITDYYSTYALDDINNPGEIYPEENIGDGTIIRYNWISNPLSRILVTPIYNYFNSRGASAQDDNGKIWMANFDEIYEYNDATGSLTSYTVGFPPNTSTVGFGGYNSLNNTLYTNIFDNSTYPYKYLLGKIALNPISYIGLLSDDVFEFNLVGDFNSEVIGKSLLYADTTLDGYTEDNVTINISNLRIVNHTTDTLTTITNIYNVNIDMDNYLFKNTLKDNRLDDLFSTCPTSKSDGDAFLFIAGTRGLIHKINITSLTSIDIFDDTTRFASIAYDFISGTTNTY